MPPITRTPRYGTVDSGPHAATVADGYDYTYDDVGNLTVADDSTSTYTYTYDVRNQLIAVDLPGTDDLTMVYDADGNRVTRTEGAITVTYIGGLYEITKVGSSVTTRTHYMFAGDLIGTRVDDGTTDTITYTFGDHLGSVTAAYTPPQNSNPDGLQTQYYKPYGEPRGTTASLPSDHTYTGQIDDPGVLMYYNARYYQPSIGRFTQPDTIIPDPGNGQDYNRYMYVRGNPIMANDPTGHVFDTGEMPVWMWDLVARETTTPDIDIGLLMAPPQAPTGTGAGLSAVVSLLVILSSLMDSGYQDSLEARLLTTAAVESEARGGDFHSDSDQIIGLWRLTDPGGQDGFYWSWGNPIEIEMFNEGGYYDWAGIPYANKGTLLVYAEFEVSKITRFRTARPAGDRPEGHGNGGGMPEFGIPGGAGSAVAGTYEPYPLEGDFVFHMCSSHGCWPSTEVTQYHLYGFAD